MESPPLRIFSFKVLTRCVKNEYTSEKPPISMLHPRYLHIIWQKFTTPQAATDTDEARREYMTKVISLLMGIVAFGLTLVFGYGWAIGLFPKDSLLITLAMAVLFGGGWWLAYLGYWQIAGYIPPVIIFLAALYGNVIGGSGAPAMVLYALAIILTAILQNEYVQWITLMLGSVAYIGISGAIHLGYITQQRFPESVFANRVVIVVGVYIALTSLLWFLVNQFRLALLRTYAYAEKLTKTNQKLAYDITVRKRAEAALRESEEKYRLLIDNANVLVSMYDYDGVCLFMNAVVANLFEGTADEFIGKSFYEIHPEAANVYIERIQAVIDSKTPQNYEDFVQFPRGARWLLSNVQPYRNVEGQVFAAQILSQDISDRKRAEEELRTLNSELEQRVKQRTAELEAVNQELKEFAYIVSHDLKAPLRGIHRLAHWLAEDYSNVIDGKGQELLNLLFGRVKRMSNLIDGILYYSRIGRIQEEYKEIELTPLLHEVLDLLNPPETLRIAIPPDLPSIFAERTHFFQVFQNLISNAVKFVDTSDGEIIVQSEDNGTHWIFFVSDNGPGIEKKHQERIFHIFQTLHPRDEIESTGIGLTLVKKIVELYGGTIGVESEPGKGATFWFTFPKE